MLALQRPTLARARPPPTHSAGRLFTARSPPHRPLAASPSASAGDAAAQQPIVQLSVPHPAGGDDFQVTLRLPAGCAAARVYHVVLKKPLGLTLTERAGLVVVDEVAAAGHAARAGVAAGDVLLATTARAETSAGANQLVLLQTAGQAFKTVAAALRSNTCAQCPITLVLSQQAAGS